MYFEDLHQRQVFVLDESYAKSYRRSRNVGLPGFFDFHFPVIHNSKEYNRIFREFQTNGLGHLANEDLWVKNMWNRTTSVDYPILRIRQFKDPRYFQETRKKAMQHYELSNSNGKDLTTFERLSRRICDNVAFHKDMLQDVQEQLQQSSIPDFANSRQANDQAANVSSLSSLGTTVAFHVRRGDKVYGKRLESKLFLEDLYVKKLVRSVPSDLDLTSIQHCYVATDEYNVTLGLEQSLQKHNISCQLHYLVPQHRNKDNLSDRQSLEDTKSFFTELYLLTRATYFVGTFNSNVGAFVAPFRACHWKGEDRGTAANRFHHYYASYGVDKDHWFIRR
uniref:Uncharacterized protein n=1 Tax=Entomoneis paludosa TaxID=265537 RepID=A0A7S2Y428_9STRA|mmetsp:Transcript_16004/g.33086  ORF Transcript_16004/g.33086 Transcript_16004/m.33086 type:complete len:335 (+) Transcript_16004:1-1005(+)